MNKTMVSLSAHHGVHSSSSHAAMSRHDIIAIAANGLEHTCKTSPIPCSNDNCTIADYGCESTKGNILSHAAVLIFSVS